MVRWVAQSSSLACGIRDVPFTFSLICWGWTRRHKTLRSKHAKSTVFWLAPRRTVRDVQRPNSEQPRDMTSNQITATFSIVAVDPESPGSAGASPSRITVLKCGSVRPFDFATTTRDPGYQVLPNTGDTTTEDTNGTATRQGEDQKGRNISEFYFECSRALCPRWSLWFASTRSATRAFVQLQVGQSSETELLFSAGYSDDHSAIASAKAFPISAMIFALPR